MPPEGPETEKIDYLCQPKSDNFNLKKDNILSLQHQLKRMSSSNFASKRLTITVLGLSVLIGRTV